jgi:hypothetical protein
VNLQDYTFAPASSAPSISSETNVNPSGSSASTKQKLQLVLQGNEGQDDIILLPENNESYLSWYEALLFRFRSFESANASD